MKVFSREKYINDPDPSFTLSRHERAQDYYAILFNGMTRCEIRHSGELEGFHYGEFDDWMEEREYIPIDSLNPPDHIQTC